MKEEYCQQPWNLKIVLHCRELNLDQCPLDPQSRADRSALFRAEQQEVKFPAQHQVALKIIIKPHTDSLHEYLNTKILERPCQSALSCINARFWTAFALPYYLVLDFQMAVQICFHLIAFWT